jgi:uncharacterized protein (DUF2141 family)
VTFFGFGFTGAAALAAAASPAAAGPDAAACAAGSRQTAVVVALTGLRTAAGSVRVSLYPDNPDAFLARGAYVRRVDVPVSSEGPMAVCIAVPGGPGRYAIAVRHDENGNGRTDWDDGGGFSRNPALSLASLRPRLEDVAFDVRAGVQRIDVAINYLGER